jgi:multidrug resistance efflux pump
MRRISALAVLVAGGALGCFFGYPDDASKGALRAHRGTFAEDMVLTGQLEAARGAVVAVPRLPSWQTSIRWIADDGAEVKEGDKIVELDSGQFTTTLDTKRQALVQAQQQLTQKQAEASADLAEKALDVERKQVEFDKARLNAAVPADIVSRRDFEDREVKRKRAEVELAKAKDVLKSTREASRADRANLELTLAKAQRELGDVEKAIDSVTLRTPKAGVVVLRDNPFGEPRKLQAGDGVFVGVALAMIPEPDSLQVTASLADVDDRKIAVGMPATIILDAYSDIRSTGRVAAISAVAQESARASLRRAFTVVVKLDAIDANRMRPGLSARVIVRREAKNGVLLAPRVALDLNGKEPRARLSDGSFRSVKVGSCNAQECVVTDGLRDGEALQKVGP